MRIPLLHLLPQTLLLGALLAPAAPALAATASATLSTITLTLTDIDPTDGITPGFTLPEGAGGTNGDAHVTTYTPTTFQEAHDLRSAPGWLTNLYASASVAGADASASGGASWLEVVLNISGDADAMAGIQTDTGGGLAALMLSPKTALTVTALGSLDLGLGALDGGNAGVWMQMQGDRTGRDDLNLSGGSSFQSRVLSMTAQNLTDANIFLTLAFGASASLMSTATPVPEPASGALILAGLGVVAGQMARRRRAYLPAR